MAFVFEDEEQPKPRFVFEDEEPEALTVPKKPMADLNASNPKAMGIGFMKGLSDLYYGGAQLAHRAGIVSDEFLKNFEQQRGADIAKYQAELESGAGKFGEFAGEVVPTLAIPGGATGGLLRRAGTSTLAGGTIGGVQPTEEGESKLSNVLTGAALGGGTAGAISGIGGLIKPAGKISKQIIGALTGKGPGSVEEGLRGNQAFKQAMRGKIEGQDVVDLAKSSLDIIKMNRGKAYSQKLAEVTENKEPIDLVPIKEEMTEYLKNFVKSTEVKASQPIEKIEQQLTVVRHPSGGGYTIQDATGNYPVKSGGHPVFYQDQETASGVIKTLTSNAAKIKTQLSREATTQFDWARTNVGPIKTGKKGKELYAGSKAGELKELYDQIMSWGSKPGDDTAVELDRLKRWLDDHYSDSSKIRAFTEHARDTVANAIKSKVPEYAEMTKAYAEATNLIKDIESNLMLRKHGMSGRIVADQTLRRLTSAMRENFEMRRELVEALGREAGQDVAGTVAGYTMSDWIPGGLYAKTWAGGVATASMFHPKMWPILAASSPRVMGEFLVSFGKAQRATAATRAATGQGLKIVAPRAAAVAGTNQ